MRKGIVYHYPPLAIEGPFGFKSSDPGFVHFVLLPDAGGEKSVERERVLGLDINPVNPFYGHVFGDNQPRQVTLEVLKRRRSEIGPEGFNSLLKPGGMLTTARIATCLHSGGML